MSTSNRPVCVVGAGTMGRGIAQVALAAGHQVSLVDPMESQRRSAVADIASRLQRRHPQIAASIEDRLGLHAGIDTTPADSETLVIEAVLEALDVKADVFTKAAHHYGPECVLATNTSSLSVTEIAARTPIPSRVVGMHFFNPVPLMRLVEVVVGLQSDPGVADEVAAIAGGWGKEVARVKSAPGFIVNRVARGFYGETLRLLEEQTASPAVIDEVIRASGQFRMGPFELMDLIGNDVNAAVTRSVWTAFNFDPRFEPSRVQDELVAAGRLGRKSGHGFYDYSDDHQSSPSPAVPANSPVNVTLAGSSAQLDTFVERSGIDVERTPGDHSLATLSDGSVLRVTRGRTARAESAALGGTPVVLLDRCIDPAATTAIAVTSSDRAAAGPAVALLDKAGVAAHLVDDAPGLVVARTLAVIANEAWSTVLHGVAAPDDVDTAMRLGTNYPVGPFEWCRRWGLAEVLELLDELWSTYHDTRYRASRNLREATLQNAT